MVAIFLKLLNMSFAASWLILAVVVLRLVLKKAPKWIICLLWVLVAVRLVCPFSFTSAFSALSLTGADVAQDGQVEYFRYAGGTEKPLVEFDTVTLSPTDETVALAPHTSSAYLPPYIGIWLIGAAVLLLYAAVSYLWLRKMVGASLHLRDNIWLCDDIKTPFILGILKPRIYLPSSMEDATQAHVLAHENAHLQRRDHLWKPLGFALLAVYWFNPLCWLAYILLCRDIELACDEKVIRSMEKPDVIAYSEALLSCSVPRRMVMVCPLAFGEVGVKERIKTVLNYKKPAFWVVIVAVVACAVVAVCFLTNPKDKTDFYRIDDVKWEMSTIVDTLNNETAIVACNETMAMLYPDAKIVSLQCTAKDGKIFLADESKTWEGSYTKMTTDPDSAIYQVVFPNQDKENGLATVSDTIYLDGSAVRTLVLSCGRYTICFYKGTDNFVVNRLSINDVRTLSGKGEALTWSDFDAYAYTETGSGLYIRVYEIDERFSLWIGGSINEPPMYIRLVSEENPDDYIDIRTEDVEAFITAHGSSVSTVGGAGTPDTVTETASDPLDAAVSAAILEHSGSDDPDGLFHCESHVTLATVSATPKVGADTHEVIVYAMVLYQEYNIANGGIQETSGSHIPTALSFEVDADGTYTLTEYWEPRDGSYYAPDIREKFPADIAEDALDTQKYILAQKQSCYAQAVEYGKVDTDAVVKGLLDIITSSPATSSNPGDYIDAHPIEYRELTYYGDFTLRYVFGEFLKGGQIDLYGNVMRVLMDELIGGEAIRYAGENGQDYFDEWREHVGKNYVQSNDASMRKNCPKGWLLLQMIG